MDIRKADQIGIISSVVVHALLIFLFLMLGKSCMDVQADPLDGGIEVSIGEPDFGGPDNDASMQEEMVEEEVIEEEQSQVTQDDAEAPEVKETPKTTKPVTKPKTTTPKTEPTKPTEPKRTVDPRSTFSKKPGSGSGSGDGPKSGQQGDPDGSNDGEPDGTGQGEGGEGFFGDGFQGKIDGFKAIGTYKPVNEQQEFGKVVIKVCVDRTGKVVSVKGGQRGTTNTSSYLNALSEQAAKKFRFERIGTASDVNCGSIVFTYKAG